jgi:flavin-dependent dehydrogenase
MLIAAGVSKLDAIVIGAGVGGAATAVHLARRLGRGDRVLLVERSAWPRAKVCGCCLNNAALVLLEELGIASSVLRDSGERLDRVEVRCGKRAADWTIPDGLAIARSTLDGLLVDRAIAAGAVFLSECSAAVAPAEAEGGRRASHRASGFRVLLRTATRMVECSAEQVFIADGLAGSALDALPEFRPVVRPDSWIGLGGIIEEDFAVASGVIGLSIGAGGYVGLVRLSNGMVNLAAAIDPAWVRRGGGPGPAVGAILATCGMQVREGAIQAWKFKGTGFLTRRRARVAAAGLFVIGDAAEYVEPFTGEGMTWALASAHAAAELGAEAILHDRAGKKEETARAWQSWQETSIRGRQRTSRVARVITHRPALASAALAMVNAVPWQRELAARITRRLSAPYSRAPHLRGCSPLLEGTL